MGRIFTECSQKEIRFKNRRKFLPFSILSLLIAYRWYESITPKVAAQPVDHKSLSSNILLKNIPISRVAVFYHRIEYYIIMPPIHTIRPL